MPSLSLTELEDMTLLEINERVEFIIEIQRDKERHHLKDLSSIIFYSSLYGFGITQSKQYKEADFHKKINELLQINYNGSSEAGSGEGTDALKEVFG